MAVMSETSDRLSDGEEIEALLPWYVSGRLDAGARARVERYLKTHPEIRSHLDLAREELDATVAGNEVLAGPGPAALARLRASIATAPRRPSIFAQASLRFADWIRDLSGPQLGFAGAAAALLLLLQAAAIGGLLMERGSDPTYQTASGREAPAEGIELLVGFSEDASIGEISNLLKQVGAVVIDGPKAGLYRLRVASTDEKGRDATEALRQSGLVTSILPRQ
jgi:hypothetical protein